MPKLTSLASGRGRRITECVVDAPRADDAGAVFLIRRLGVPATGAPLSVEPGMWARWELSKLTFPPELVDASGAARATSYFMWSVLPNNASEVPFPPLHNHHAAFKPKATQSRHPSWLKGFKPAFHAAAPGSAPDSWCEPRGGGAGRISTAIGARRSPSTAISDVVTRVLSVTC